MFPWVSLQHYAVDLMGVNLKCIDAFAVMDMKFHVFVTKHKTNT